MDYNKLFQLANLELQVPLSYVKKHHITKCLNCNHIWNPTPISIMQIYKKYKTNACPICNKQRRDFRKKNSRVTNIQKLKDRGFEILSDYDGRYVQGIPGRSIPVDVTVKNINCGHTFTTDSKNLLSRNVTCPICAREYKNSILAKSSKDRSSKWAKTAPEWKAYRFKVRAYTKASYVKHISKINPNNLPRGLAGEVGKYHLDHIVPTKYCFLNNIPPEHCGHWSNLQMLDWKHNIQCNSNLKVGIKIPKILQKYIIS